MLLLLMTFSYSPFRCSFLLCLCSSASLIVLLRTHPSSVCSSCRMPELRVLYYYV
uniref:Uncharacterized protein n=1 Tax=Arundo donax TaxID=35708 RepID=A0A0A8XQ08_ARUDO